MTQEEVIWSTMDNQHGEVSLKQHAYMSVQRKRPWSGELYEGNKTLCSKLGASYDGEIYTTIDRIDSEAISENACKKCLKIFHNQQNK